MPANVWQMEYKTAREEYFKQIELRQKLIEITLSIAGIILGIALTKEVSVSIALVYPFIALFLTIGWFATDWRIFLLEHYMMGLENASIGRPKLHNFLNINEPLSNLFDNSVSHIGVIIITQLIAIFVGISYDSTIGKQMLLTLPITTVTIHNIYIEDLQPELFLIYIDLLSIFLMIDLLILRLRRHPPIEIKKKKRERENQ